MFEVTLLAPSDLPVLQDLHRISAEYSTGSYYVVSKTESEHTDASLDLPETVSFNLQLKHNQPPLTGVEWVPESTDLERYTGFLPDRLSFKATHGFEIVGMIIASVEEWNSSVKVWELIVDKRYQRSGAGKLLMAAVVAAAKARSGVSRIVCETQTRNVRALSFYLKSGFCMEAVDMSLYGLDGLAKQNVAVFMYLDLAKDASKKGSESNGDSVRVLKLEDCVNAKCPNSGKPVAADSLTLYRGRVVGFCNSHCRDEFANCLVVFDDTILKRE
ncbi:hypothetical protein HDU98_007669 [Podochytrium sp. JEL0797]|nr:hypothetical protein HDU98_007669 [Podochytrium sp. JEL0797]